MELIINEHKSIAEIQREFEHQFPYLKIQFYTYPCDGSEDCMTENLISSEKKIGQIRSKPYSGTLGISGNQKTSSLKKIFRDVYGLNIEIFRRSGVMWMQPINTDNRTIDEQNEIAREFTSRDIYLAG
jgi:hypothetical protein